MTKNKGGRPPAKIDVPKLKALMRLNPTLKDVSAFFELGDRTIERFIKDEFHCTFGEFKEQNMVHTRLNLIRKAVHEATKDKPNTALLIFCLKNLCGWRDKDPEQPANPEDNKILLAYEIRRKDSAQPKSIDA